jgi:hypothetical protein
MMTTDDVHPSHILETPGVELLPGYGACRACCRLLVVGDDGTRRVLRAGWQECRPGVLALRRLLQ